MLSLFPSSAAIAWFGQNGWWLVFAAVIVVAATRKALRDGTNSDGWSDAGPPDSCHDDGSCGVD